MFALIFKEYIAKKVIGLKVQQANRRPISFSLVDIGKEEANIKERARFIRVSKRQDMEDEEFKKDPEAMDKKWALQETASEAHRREFAAKWDR